VRDRARRVGAGCAVGHDAMTRLCNFFAQLPAQKGFCMEAERVLAEAATVAPSAFIDFAEGVGLQKRAAARFAVLARYPTRPPIRIRCGWWGGVSGLFNQISVPCCHRQAAAGSFAGRVGLTAAAR
jgi:hypothetical protein